ncbi:hypothetical protein phD2B_0019 [Lelliottia phage phD2B]|uniref:Uncharacterized protein n=1 Tax=Lelliottia phage phD2B TaxID=1542498 RepID=A0A088FT58_9CAUD|nr:hypothetical protein phD2B_0019 [Lelliottia phage phD2B]AIM51245.1 hypothetical protein phD2B_0019 [Lelliottia phage phD2B]
MFTIETISNRVVKAGKLVAVESFIIVDAEGSLISGTKSYDTREEAQAKIDSMGNLAEGLAFAKAAFPGMADKALVGKANAIAAYLDWIAAGRPVKSVEEAAADVASEETVVAEPAAPAVDEEETF